MILTENFSRVIPIMKQFVIKTRRNARNVRVPRQIPPHHRSEERRKEAVCRGSNKLDVERSIKCKIYRRDSREGEAQCAFNIIFIGLVDNHRNNLRLISFLSPKPMRLEANQTVGKQSDKKDRKGQFRVDWLSRWVNKRITSLNWHPGGEGTNEGEGEESRRCLLNRAHWNCKWPARGWSRRSQKSRLSLITSKASLNIDTLQVSTLHRQLMWAQLFSHKYWRLILRRREREHRLRWFDRAPRHESANRRRVWKKAAHTTRCQKWPSI